MDTFASYLKTIPKLKEEMIELVASWSNINSGSYNTDGLKAMSEALQDKFQILEGHMEEISLPTIKRIGKDGKEMLFPIGKAISIKKRPQAKTRVFFGGHMDTIFPKTSSFQKVERLNDRYLKGPGVADMKGGLVVMLKALEVFEKTPFSKHLGWEILINSDEEIGSPGSSPLLKEIAKRNQVGFIFEPALPDGKFINKRKGSASYSLAAYGKAAHVGREIHQGKNAIHALARVICQMEAFHQPEKGTTLNIGFIEGGGPVNIVPDFALCRFNIRFTSQEQLQTVLEKLEKIIQSCKSSFDVSLELYQDSYRPPKPYDSRAKALFEQVKHCSEFLGLPFSLNESGGVCDGNNLAAAGLPTVDTMGVIGENIHTQEEKMEIESLVTRTQLTLLLLLNLATGENLIKEKSL